MTRKGSTFLARHWAERAKPSAIDAAITHYEERVRTARERRESTRVLLGRVIFSDHDLIEDVARDYLQECDSVAHCEAALEDARNIKAHGIGTATFMAAGPHPKHYGFQGARDATGD